MQFNWSDPGSFDLTTYCVNPDEEEETYRIKHTLSTVAFILNVPLTMSICIIGIIGNGLCGVVLFKKRFRRSSFFILLGSLAVVDCVNLIVILLSAPSWYYSKDFCYGTNSTFSEEWKSIFSYIVTFDEKVWFSAQSASFYLLVVMNAERFTAVFYPLKVRVFFTTKKTVSMILWIVVFCAYVHSRFLRDMILDHVHNYYMRFATEFCEAQRQGKDEDVLADFEKCCQKATRKYSGIKVYVRYFLDIFGVNVIPFVIIFTLNCFIGYGIHRAKKQRTKLTRQSSNDQRSFNDLINFTSMISKATFFNLTCLVVLIVRELYWNEDDNYITNLPTFVTEELLYSIIGFGSAVNPFIYTMHSAAIRNELKRMFFLSSERINSTSIGQQKSWKSFMGMQESDSRKRNSTRDSNSSITSSRTHDYDMGSISVLPKV